MRRSETLNQNWRFIGPDKKEVSVNIPHTWNAVDGQDGGNDYWRGSCIYTKTFDAPAYDRDTSQTTASTTGSIRRKQTLHSTAASTAM